MADFERLGLFYLGRNYDLATRLSNLIASPGFEAWLSGVPLEIDQMLCDRSS